MARSRSAAPNKQDDSEVAVWLLAALLIFSPLLKGGNDPLPLLVLELGSLLIFARLLQCPAFRHHLPGPFIGLLLLLLLLPLIYLLPVPLSYWGQLPGREWYRELIEFAAGGSLDDGWRQPSLLPFRTEVGWYSSLFPLAVFLLTVGMPRRKLRLMIGIVVAMAVFQAVLGLIQFGQGPDSVFRLGNLYYPESAVGTYASRNHMVGLLYMALPLALVQMLNAISPDRGADDPKARSGGRRQRGKGLRSTELGRALLYGVFSIAILVGMIFTRSRTGIVLGVSGLVVTGLMFVPRLGRRALMVTIGIVVVIGLLAVLATGVAPVLERFAGPDTIENSRWDIFAAAFEGAKVFFPLGVGPSGFPDVFPRFQPLEMSGFVNRAHNDFLELLFEGGLLLIVPAVALVIGFLFAWIKLLRRQARDSFTDLQMVAGLGVLLMLLHSLVDFNLHIPANMGYFAFLSGVVLHRHSPESRSRRRRGGKRERARAPVLLATDRTIPDENKINPFE